MLSLIRTIMFVFPLTVNFFFVAAVDTTFDGTESPTIIIATNNQPTECTDNCTQPPTISPTPFPNPSPAWDTTTSVDILVAALFLIAAGWLVLAIIYSALILIVVRMRARGELDIYDESFGRIFLFGGRCYIPLGCLLRRHVVALNHRNQQQTVRLMTRGERRSAMEELLTDAGTGNNITSTSDRDGENGRPQQQQNAAGEDQENNDLDSNGEPGCSICLMEYEEDDVCFTSRTCIHKFHRDCLLDWLERRDHTECPCCREPMVADEDVWDSVQLMRRQQRKLRRRQTREKGVLGLFSCFCASCCCCIVVAPDNSYEEGEDMLNDAEEGNVTDMVEMGAHGYTTGAHNFGLGVGMGVPFGGDHENAADTADSEEVLSHEPSTVGMGVPCGDVEHETITVANDSEDVNSNEQPSVGMGVPCGNAEHETAADTTDSEDVSSHEPSVVMGVPCGHTEHETAADPTDSGKVISHEPSSVGMGVPCGDVEHEAAADATASGEVSSYEPSVGMGVPIGDVDNVTTVATDTAEVKPSGEQSPDAVAAK